MQNDKLIIVHGETDEDFEKIFSIRKKVFVEEQGVPELEEYDGYEAVAHHYLALWEGVPAGCARWRITPYMSIKLERFAVLPEYRGKRIGVALVQAVLNELPAGYPIMLHAQEHAVGFYEKLGFGVVGEKFYECDIAHFAMEKVKV